MLTPSNMQEFTLTTDFELDENLMSSTVKILSNLPPNSTLIISGDKVIGLKGKTFKELELDLDGLYIKVPAFMSSEDTKKLDEVIQEYTKRINEKTEFIQAEITKLQNRLLRSSFRRKNSGIINRLNVVKTISTLKKLRANIDSSYRDYRNIEIAEYLGLYRGITFCIDILTEKLLNIDDSEV